MRTFFWSLVAAGALAATASAATATDRTIPLEAAATDVAFAPDGRSLYVVTAGRNLLQYDVAAGRIERTYALDNDERRPGVQVAAGRFTTVSTAGAVRLRDLKNGNAVATFSVPVARARIGTVAAASDGSLLAIAGGDPAAASANIVHVVDRTGQPRFRFPAGIGAVGAMAFSPDGGTLVAASFDADIRIWDVRTGKLVHCLEEMPLAMFDLDFSRDGRLLATAGADQTIYLWDTKTWRIVRRLEGQPETVRRLRFSPDGTRLVSGGMSALDFEAPVKVILWGVASGRSLRTWETAHRVNALAFSSDGRQVAVADGSKQAKVWAVPN